MRNLYEERNPFAESNGTVRPENFEKFDNWERERINRQYPRRANMETATGKVVTRDEIMNGAIPHGDQAAPAPKQTKAESKLGPIEYIPLKEIDPGQEWNPRSIITKSQIEVRAKGLQTSGESDKTAILYAHENPKSGFKYRCLVGNIDMLAMTSLGRDTIKAQVFKGTVKEAKFKATINNESHQATSSYDKARDLLSKKKEFNYPNTEALCEDLKVSGWPISRQHADNLIGAYVACIPELLKSWQYAHVNVEEKPQGCVAVTDDTMFWAKTLSKEDQRKVYNRLFTGEKWQDVKRELASKEGRAPKSPVHFMGAPFKARPPDEYQQKMLEACNVLRENRFPPSTIAAVEYSIKHVLTGSDPAKIVKDVAIYLEAEKKNAQRAVKSAGKTAKKTTAIVKKAAAKRK